MFDTGWEAGLSVDDGFQVAIYFFMLGLLWLFIAALVLGMFQAVRSLLG